MWKNCIIALIRNIRRVSDRHQERNKTPTKVSLLVACQLFYLIHRVAFIFYEFTTASFVTAFKAICQELSAIELALD